MGYLIHYPLETVTIWCRQLDTSKPDSEIRYHDCGYGGS